MSSSTCRKQTDTIIPISNPSSLIPITSFDFILLSRYFFNTTTNNILLYITINGQYKLLKPNELFINDNINNLTIKERIEGHTLPCYSYIKHWSKSPNGQPTVHVLLTNETTNLSIIEIDIKSYTDEQPISIRYTLLSRLSTNDIIVQSTSGSLHIYINTDDFPVYQNALI